MCAAGEKGEHWQRATQFAEALIRYSVGIDNTEDLIQDLRQNAVRPRRTG